MYQENKDAYLNKLSCLGPEFTSPGASSALYITNLRASGLVLGLSVA